MYALFNELSFWSSGSWFGLQKNTNRLESRPGGAPCTSSEHFQSQGSTGPSLHFCHLRIWGPINWFGLFFFQPSALWKIKKTKIVTLQKFGNMMGRVTHSGGWGRYGDMHQKHKYMTYDISRGIEKLKWGKGFEVNLSIKCEQRRQGLQPPAHPQLPPWQSFQTSARYRDITPTAPQQGKSILTFLKKNKYLWKSQTLQNTDT